MAPSAAFKRSRTAFSPPRPGKSKITKSTKEKGANAKTAARHSLGGMGNSKIHKQQRKAKVAQRQKQSRKAKPKGAAGTMRAILREANSDSSPEDEDEDGGESEERETMDATVEDGEQDDDDDGEDNDEDAQEDEDEEDASLAPDPDLNISSPEPDFILAEVTTRTTNTTSTSATDPAIPLPLIHRIMHAHFSSPDQTSLSSDARRLMGKYTEIFVKEAIRRCVDDKRERAAHDKGDGGRDGIVVGDTGWLEVEDLERVGVQLCLDF